MRQLFGCGMELFGRNVYFPSHQYVKPAGAAIFELHGLKRGGALDLCR